jgi:uncharacterized SAM-binding protein YcdF (DUF218 family)
MLCRFNNKSAYLQSTTALIPDKYYFYPKSRVMFFILSKVLLFLISPVMWVLALLIAAIIVKNRKVKYRVLIAATAVLLIFSNPALLNQFAKHWDLPPGELKAPSYSCAIVLGGFVMTDGHENGLFSGAADRFIQGLKLKVTGKASKILVSGGNGTLMPGKFREATWVRTQLLEFNVPDTCILIESNSRNTIENAAFSKELLIKNHLQPPYLLVTSAFHMRRSVGIFKKAGMEVIPYPCNYLSGREKFSFFQFTPDAETFYKWHLYIKEVVGVAVNYFKK